jgi:23S rRNA pseudouridine2604 synthase
MDKSLNKYISETGFCSRREADKYIEQGRVSINDNIAIKGNRVLPGDVVAIDGEPIKKSQKTVYLVFNKPVGITCTTDLKDKYNIISFINYKSRIFPVGRLDKQSEGLIFLTNDGDIVNKILRAGNNHEKEYIVTVDKPITGDFVTRMGNGVRILDTVTRKCFVKQEGKNRFRIILTQGLNRQIRRMCQVLGYNVVTLKRVRIMNITLANLPVGKWRYFTPEEIKTMDQLVAGSSKTATSDPGGNDMQE